MAKLYDRVMARYETWAGPRRQALLAGLTGTVLELGPGTGVNFAHFPSGIRWMGVEPNPHMHAALAARAREHGFEADIQGVGVEGLAVGDASVDAVVCTLVLCSVPEPARTLAEVRRVLKPGGRFLFFEHVAARPGSVARRRQRWLRGIWRFCADGCTLDRESAKLIRAAGFSRVELEALQSPAGITPGFVASHVVGVGVN